MVNIIVREREKRETLREFVERQGGDIIYKQIGEFCWEVITMPSYFNRTGYGRTPMDAARMLCDDKLSVRAPSSYYDVGINENPELVRACAKGER